VILITGSTGFIGSRLLKFLDLKKFATREVLRKEDKVSNDFVICNLESQQLDPLSFYDVDTVFHLAGQAHETINSLESRQSCEDINFTATINLAKQASHYGVKKFIYVSSVKAGRINIKDLNYKIHEDHDSKDFYGIIKRKTELKLLELNESSEMSISIVRPALVYGPNVKGNLRSLIDGIDKGWFPPIPENRNKKSLIHVDDLVRALFSLSKSKMSDGEIYTATDDYIYSSKEIYDSIRKSLGKKRTKWRVPYVFFNFISKIHPYFKIKIIKLMGDDYYANNIKNIGFKAKLKLEHINEELF